MMAARDTESRLLTVESIPNKGYCLQEVRHRATTSAQDCDLALSALPLRGTTAPQLARDLAALFGRRISRQTVYRRFTKTVLCDWHIPFCVSLTASNSKDQLLQKQKH
ncbi:hypothetical protein TNCV_3254651 [Trichonephila clavipes]|nr:hypothetical protein TNCV_3254651 [Trichonephila clavipes]